MAAGCSEPGCGTDLEVGTVSIHPADSSGLVVEVDGETSANLLRIVPYSRGHVAATMPHSLEPGQRQEGKARFWLYPPLAMGRHKGRSRAVHFADALDYINARKKSRACTVVALDQPTIVPNEQGMRPAEKVAAALLSFTGGGVQPANRSKKNMFGDHASRSGTSRMCYVRLGNVSRGTTCHRAAD